MDDFWDDGENVERERRRRRRRRIKGWVNDVEHREPLPRVVEWKNTNFGLDFEFEQQQSLPPNGFNQQQSSTDSPYLSFDIEFEQQQSPPTNSPSNLSFDLECEQQQSPPPNGFDQQQSPTDSPSLSFDIEFEQQQSSPTNSPSNFGLDFEFDQQQSLPPNGFDQQQSSTDSPSNLSFDFECDFHAPSSTPSPPPNFGFDQQQSSTDSPLTFSVDFECDQQQSPPLDFDFQAPSPTPSPAPTTDSPAPFDFGDFNFERAPLQPSETPSPSFVLFPSLDLSAPSGDSTTSSGPPPTDFDFDLLHDPPSNSPSNFGFEHESQVCYLKF